MNDIAIVVVFVVAVVVVVAAVVAVSVVVVFHLGVPCGRQQSKVQRENEKRSKEDEAKT